MSTSPIFYSTQYDGGLYTREFTDRLQENQSPAMKNIEFVGTSIRKALGFQKFGADTEPVTGFRLFNHRVRSEEFLVKVVGSTIKVHDETDDAWYPICGNVFTAKKKFWMDSFNGILYGGNGIENFFTWDGNGSGKAKIPILAAATTIDLETGTGTRFASSGSGFVQGEPFTWSGVTGDQLTGVTGIVVPHPAGSQIWTAINLNYPTNPKGSVGAVFGARSFVRDDENPNFFYYSKFATTGADPITFLTDFVSSTGSGDAGFIIFPSKILGSQKFISGSNLPMLCVFCADGIAYDVKIDDSTVGVTVDKTNPMKVLATDLISQDAIGITENDMILIDNAPAMRAVGYGDLSTTIKTTRLSDEIEPTLKQIDFSDCNIIYFQRRVHFLGKANNADINNAMIVKDTNPVGFLYHDMHNLNYLVEHKNRLFGLSSFNSDVYELYKGLSANGGVITSYYETPQLNFGLPQIYKVLHKIRIHGYITTNCNLTIKMFCDEDSKPLNEWTINGNDTKIVSSNPAVSIGTVVFSTEPFAGPLFQAGGVPIANVRAFEADLVFSNFKYFIHAHLSYSNAEADTMFALNEALFFGEAQDSDVALKNAYTKAK